VTEDDRSAEPLPDLDELALLVEALVGRGECPPEEIAPADEQNEGEDDDRAERTQVLAASAVRVVATCYGVLRFRASR
jgi:hypothetical protein